MFRYSKNTVTQYYKGSSHISFTVEKSFLGIYT